MTSIQLRTGPRLALGFGALIFLMIAMVAVSCLQLMQTSTALVELKRLQDGDDLSTEWTHKTALNVERAVAVAKSAGMAEVDAHFAPLMMATSAEISGLQKSMTELVVDPDGKALMATVAARRDTYIGARRDMLALLVTGDKATAKQLLADKVLPASSEYLQAMKATQQWLNDKAAVETDHLQARIRRSRDLLIGLLIAGIAIGGVTALLITRSIVRPLQRGIEATRLIATGDLSKTIESSHRDEAGELLRGMGQMQQSLRNLVSQVRSATDSIGTASAEIATGNLDLSTRTEQTASNLQQAASSMEQLTGTVRQSADSAAQANQLANSAAEVAARGGVVVSQVVATMDDINTSSKRIADIIGVIDGIAFQTNILALNAAVEAARAGEQGRGFAVVASEVRNLAARSADAAREIKGLIGASVGRVEEGTAMVDKARATMTEVVDSIQRVTGIVGEISAASHSQSTGVAQIGQAVAQMDEATQRNAALVEQSAAAAGSLSMQAQQLVHAVAVFKLVPTGAI